jgi:transposase
MKIALAENKHNRRTSLAFGVKLVYLPPYSPDLNQIEEFFAELKAFIKRNWLAKVRGNPGTRL